MPRSSAADAAQTALRIRAAAAKLFAEHGIAATSLDAIARDAGVTRGAVYHHYSDRTALVRAAAEHLQEGIASRVAATAEEHSDPRSQLIAGSIAFVDAITEGEVARLLLSEVPAAVGWAAWREIDADASVRELRDGVAALPGMPPEDVDATVQLLSGAMNDAALWLAASETGPEARDAAHRSLARIVGALADSLESAGSDGADRESDERGKS